MYGPAQRLVGAFLLLFALMSTTGTLAEEKSADYRGTLRVVKFDVSPPLRDIPPIPIPRAPDEIGGLMVDPEGTEGRPVYGPQTPDEKVQQGAPAQDIPDPVISFDSLSNISGVSPPDPVGDVGPGHYVAMSNLSFAVYDKTGTLAFGPAANNSLWSGFGGPCQIQNAGDPIVLYDQFADRWLLTQFTAGTAPYYNCVALSQTSDPMGSWYRWQIDNGGRFPDYPKWGIGEEAYYLATRDFTSPTGSFLGVGAFALNRAEMIAGNPSPTVISFFVDNSTPEVVGDGLLPMDVDGFAWPPDSSKHYYIGAQDDGGPYGASLDAINIWEFVVDFGTPANSSFTLKSTVPISPYDTIFPCMGSRSCVPQPDTSNRLDHQGNRQRALNRAAYRNFGTHESIVTLQSVEAAPAMSGMRWWEIRSPGATPTIFQEGTFGPGVEDGIHRWFGSAAMDSAGNIALGYSASNATDTFPSVWYSGRVATDAPGTMPRGEGVIVDGTGSQTGSQRWGDYSSMNVDPVDDCTFWYVNEYLPAMGGNWHLQVGAFHFDECGDPGFSLSVVSEPQVSICAGDEAQYELSLGSVEGFTNDVSLAAMGNPAPSSVSFLPNPVAPPGMSTMTVSNTGGVSAGEYAINITGSATDADPREFDIDLSVFVGIPPAPTQLSPVDNAIDVALNPLFGWTPIDGENFTIEVATDIDFNNIVFTETTTTNEWAPPQALSSSSTYFWRVRAGNACGDSELSSVFSFTTIALPGDCQEEQVEVIVYDFDFEDGDQGWVSGSNQGPDTWALSTANPGSGAQHWHVDNQNSSSDSYLTSPVLAIPFGVSDLTFRFSNYQYFESPPLPNCWDGGMLEVSTNGGADFSEVVDGDLLTDSYDGPLQDLSNPLQGRQAWCGAPQLYTDSRVDISALAGQENVVFRFRVGTDGSAGAPGWDIDDVRIMGCTTVLNLSSGFEDSE